MTTMERVIAAFNTDPWVRTTAAVLNRVPFDYVPFGDLVWDLLCDVQHWRMRVHLARLNGVSGSTTPTPH
jgi:hypothetical protein